MSVTDVRRARLVAQCLVGTGFPGPVEAVSAFAAMQGQDLPGVLASAALRSTGSLDDVFEALADGRLVRGYPMRGTVFLMPGNDVRWITELSAGPSLRAAAARRHQLGLDEEQLTRARASAEGAVAEGPLTRSALFGVWEGEGLAPAGGRGYHMLFTLIAGGVLVYGPWNGSEQDVALREQWLPASPGLADLFDGERVPAVAELLRRYLLTHGPATLRDFAWWTKLPLKVIRAALPLIVDTLESDRAEEASFWRPGLLDDVAELGRSSARPILLPGFDEYVLGYADRLFAMEPDHHSRLVPGNNGVFRKSVVVGGRVRGTWSRGGRPGGRVLEIDAFEPISPSARKQLETRFTRFPFTTA